MQRHYMFLALISAFIVACSACDILFQFYTSGLPLSITIVYARTAVIRPAHGFALPSNIQVGDQIDLPALDRSARAAITISNLEDRLPLGRIYQFDIQRDGRHLVVPVATVNLGATLRMRLLRWLNPGFFALMGMLAPLSSWLSVLGPP